MGASLAWLAIAGMLAGGCAGSVPLTPAYYAKRAVSVMPASGQSDAQLEADKEGCLQDASITVHRTQTREPVLLGLGLNEWLLRAET